MTNQYLWNRIAGSDHNLRAADADRERIAERLRQGHAEGRLDLAEFQQRLERCYEAKTFGELRELVVDLPRAEGQDERRSPGRYRPRRGSLFSLAPILLALIVVSAAIGHHVFWLWIPVVFLLWRVGWWRQRRRWAPGRRGSDELV